MALERGDRVTTDAHSSVVVSFGSARVLLEPDTSVVLGSFSAWFGETLAEGPSQAQAAFFADHAELTRKDAQGPARCAKESWGPASRDVSPAREQELPLWAQNTAAPPGSKPASSAPKTAPKAAAKTEAPSMSIFARFGRLFVDGMDTETKNAKMARKGTRYHVAVERQTSATTVTVIEGEVIVSSTQVSAQPVALTSGTRVQVDAQGPGKSTNLPPTELASLSAQAFALGKPLGPLLQVPNLLGLSVAQASELVQRMGLQLDQAADAPAAGDAIVLAQVPSAGTDALAGTALRLTAAPTRPTVGAADESSAASSEVPDVTGAAPEAALKTLQEAGLSGWIQTSSRSGLKHPRVLSQQPFPGQQVRSGDPVQLTVAIPPNEQGK
jgi:hypothetical protein